MKVDSVLEPSTLEKNGKIHGFSPRKLIISHGFLGLDPEIRHTPSVPLCRGVVQWKRVQVSCFSSFSRGAILNWTYGTHQNLYISLYVLLYTWYNILSFLLWPPANRCLGSQKGQSSEKEEEKKTRPHKITGGTKTIESCTSWIPPCEHPSA